MMADLLRQEIATSMHTVVVKVGSRVLTRADGTLNEERVGQLAEEIHELLSAQCRVVLVSSGAVAAGMGRLGLTNRPASLPHLQAVAAVGQSHLVEAYERRLRAHGHHAAQVLLTAEDFDDRTRYLNVRNTLQALLDFGAVPIINENDTVSVEELQTTFGDNDRLAALVTNLIRAPLLVLLSDVDGLYDGSPDSETSQLISTVHQVDESVMALVRDRLTGMSKGGMASKLRAARIATAAGENVIIGNGRRPGVLANILAGVPVGTLFLAEGQIVTSWKRWIGYTVQPRGFLVLDDGARRAIQQQGRSLLAVGIADLDGQFSKGDVVALRDAHGFEFARGLINYDAGEILRIKGLRTEEIANVLGHCYDEVIHRDNIVVTA